mmetsp:Transcript_13928/g.37017  ORF Transcript_13928/g.37017 Transcript_13928/m.37017 type:complete len:502 (-) Transcript_13928:109-1614(-)
MRAVPIFCTALLRVVHAAAVGWHDGARQPDQGSVPDDPSCGASDGHGTVQRVEDDSDEIIALQKVHAQHRTRPRELDPTQQWDTLLDRYPGEFELGSANKVAQFPNFSISRTFPVQDEWASISRGPPAVCIDGSPYSFQVMLGDPKKLMIYFQGGGACWNEISSAAPLCTTFVHNMGYTGVFDRHNESNPYKTHTIVHINYCSGDAHVGNASSQRFRVQNSEGRWVKAKQMGYYNALAGIEWIKEQPWYEHGSLDLLVVMGCSAGSLGAQPWAPTLLREFPAVYQSVVADSYLGIFPEGTQGPIIGKTFNACGLPLLSSSLAASCDAGTITVQEMVEEALSTTDFGNVSWTYVNSKTDAVQISFYSAICLLGPGNLSQLISPDEYYALVNEVLLQYESVSELDLSAFIVEGCLHCFTPSSEFIGADGLGTGPVWVGPRGNASDAVPPVLEDWLARLSGPLARAGEQAGWWKTDRYVCDSGGESPRPDGAGPAAHEPLGCLE